MVGNRRQGWALYAAMAVLMVGGIVRRLRRRAERLARPRSRPGSSWPPATAPRAATSRARSSATGSPAAPTWATVTTDASNGSVNSAHDAYTGIGGAVPLANMMTGEVIFGGVGSGLYGMLLFVLLTVFIAGLMVGRTPEYLGKKIEAREVKLVLIGVLVMPIVVLGLTGARDRDQVRRPVDLQPRPAGLLRDALRLHLADQQQRLRVRRLHRLRPAERARQRRLVRDHLRRPARRPGAVLRPLPAA